MDFFTGDHSAPKCPTAVASWQFHSQTSGKIEDDATLKVVCDGGPGEDKPGKIKKPKRSQGKGKA